MIREAQLASNDGWTDVTIRSLKILDDARLLAELVVVSRMWASSSYENVAPVREFRARVELDQRSMEALEETLRNLGDEIGGQAGRASSFSLGAGTDGECYFQLTPKRRVDRARVSLEVVNSRTSFSVQFDVDSTVLERFSVHLAALRAQWAAR